MSATFQTLAVDALEDLGCLRPGQSPATDVLNSMLRRTNRFIDGWRIDNLMAYAYPSASYTLTAGQQQYTIGPTGADFTAQRPTDIRDANIILNTFSPVVRSPLAIIDVDRWSLIRVQTLPNAIPLEIYYDGNFNAASGYATINLWPGPLTTYQLEIFTSITLPFLSFADLNSTSYLFPPGYEMLMQKAIAAECAPMLNMFCKSSRMDALMMPSGDALARVEMQYKEAKYAVQADNAPAPERPCDPAWSSAYRGPGWVYASGDYGRRRS